MKAIGLAKLLSAPLLAGIVAASPAAFAQNANDLPEPGPGIDWADVSQVLVIPQQCDKEAVAVLCDRSGASSASETSGAPSDLATAESAAEPNAVAAPQDQDSENSASDPGSRVYGSVDDYQNQYETPDPSGPAYVAVPVYVPPVYFFSAAPVVVRPPAAPGPHFLSPLLLGRHPLGGGGFRRR